MGSLQHDTSVLRETEKFCEETLRPNVPFFEENEGVTKDVINSLAAKGFLAAPFPKEYGGLDLHPIEYGYFTEIIGKACVATRSLITVHSSLVGLTLLRFGTECQKSKWVHKLASGELLGAFALTEKNAGSDVKGIQTTWHETDDSYVINGSKKWITYGCIADIFIVAAHNKGKLTTFLVDANAVGVHIKKMKGVMASKATYLAEIQFDNVHIPKENVLGPLNFGFEFVISSALDNGRYSIAWAGVAIAQEALDAMVSYARNRKQFEETLSSFQTIRGMIGDAVTKVHAARSLCIQAGKMRAMSSENAIVETTIAKYFASKIAVDVTNDALQVHGANGFSDKYPVERLYREAKVLEIIEGSSQMQQEMIASHGLNQYGLKEHS